MDADRKQIYQTGGKEDMPDLMQESDENKIRIAKELLLEEVHRLQEERSVLKKNGTRRWKS